MFPYRKVQSYHTMNQTYSFGTTKNCSVIKMSCLADVNVTRKTNEILQKHASLLRNLQMLHNDYKFKIIPIIIGALFRTISKHPLQIYILTKK